MPKHLKRNCRLADTVLENQSPLITLSHYGLWLRLLQQENLEGHISLLLRSNEMEISSTGLTLHWLHSQSKSLSGVCPSASGKSPHHTHSASKAPARGFTLSLTFTPAFPTHLTHCARIPPLLAPLCIENLVFYSQIFILILILKNTALEYHFLDYWDFFKTLLLKWVPPSLHPSFSNAMESK